MLRAGLAGSLGSGKSTVAAMLSSRPVTFSLPFAPQSD
jgi:dephospho-CoA kinase